MKLLPQVMVQQGAQQGTLINLASLATQEVIASLCMEAQIEEAVFWRSLLLEMGQIGTEVTKEI